MLAVLVGITNRAKWKKPKQRQRNSSITIQEYKHTQQDKRGRKGQHFAPFLLRIVRKGKRKHNNIPTTTNKDTQGHIESKGKREDKSKAKKMKTDKKEGKHAKGLLSA